MLSNLKAKQEGRLLSGYKLRGMCKETWGPRAPVVKGNHSGAAGGEEGKWYVGLHSERIQVQE